MSNVSKTGNGVQQQVRAALREFFERSERGEAIDREQFLAAHPDIAEALRLFLDVEAQAGQMTSGQPPTGSTRSLAHRAVETAAFSQQPEPDPLLAGGESNPLSLPPQFGRYRILRALGSGAMGTVYLAEDTTLKRQVALKTSQFAKNAGLLLERFYREARSAATLRHANICPVFDVGEIDGRHFISMAYIEGKTLGDRIKPKSQLPERQALIVVRKLALALQEAHDHGVIHRDLKPANVMVDTKGEPIITDFGLACITQQEDQSRITQSGTILGTPAYMSPEQVQGDVQAITGAADQYSLGVMLYQMLTGALPFSGPMSAVIASILTREPAPPRELRPQLDPRIEALCLRMIAKSAKDRYPSMKAVADEIALLLKSPAAEPPKPAAQTEPIPSVIVTASVPDSTSPKSAAAKRAAGPSVIEPPLVPPSLEPELALPPKIDISPKRTLASRAKKRKQTDGGRKVLLGALLAVPLVLLAVVFFFRSEKGTIQVTILDPKAKVELQGQTITLNNSGQTVTIKPGEATLQIQYAGGEFTTQKFTLKNGENAAVVVEVVDDRLSAKMGAQVLGQWPVGETKPVVNTATGIVAAAPAASIPVDAVEFQGHAYKYFATQLTWKEAKLRCEQMGGHLPIVETAPENKFLVDLADKGFPAAGRTGKESIWLGLTDEVTEGEWRWVDGTRISYTNWYANQPNNKQNEEHYALLWLSNDPARANEPLRERGRWSDQPNRSEQHLVHFICEWDSTPSVQSEWTSLFNGRDLSNWRKYATGGRIDFGWNIDSGVLYLAAGSSGGDIRTVETYGDFELEFDWKISAGGNSGVIYRSRTGDAQSFYSGPEYQIVDDDRYPTLRNGVQSAGAMYNVAAPTNKSLRPAGEWNSGKIVARGPKLEHYLNGAKVVSVEIGTADWNQRVAQSNFSKWPQFGTVEEGYIVLQDHGNPVWYRNLRIRRLPKEQ